MEEKLITIAIHSLEKAQVLKNILEKENIKVYIHTVDLVQPDKVTAGVRVRIKESDLTKALSIIEQANFYENVEKYAQEVKVEKNKILVPIDFSDYAQKACEFGFRLAQVLNAEVMLFHAYYTPVYGSLTFAEIAYEINESDSVKSAVKKIETDIQQLKGELEEKIKAGKLPNVPFKYAIAEGVPEEEILTYIKNYRPTAVVMGTRGKDHKDIDLIGSVTAEVIENSPAPVFTIPENAPLTDFFTVKNIAYATNFGQKDLIDFEHIIQFLAPFKFKIHFIHIQQKEDVWNEIRLAGIRDYFQKNYPDLKADYHLIKNEDDILTGIDNFVKEHKIDIITVNTHKRNIFARLFNPSLSRKMIFHSDTPMLIFHGC
ncbi:MAG: universal stress protein [Prevotellaceae bacterium]|jgi:nucleotide-binding universal stress UspA family protein|nr:universal stress protein [Prevotellaceae bacterium]